MFQPFKSWQGIKAFIRYNYILVIILLAPMLVGIYKVMECNDPLLLRFMSIICMILITFFAMALGQRRQGAKSIAQDKHPMLEFVIVLLVYIALFTWIFVLK